MRRISLGSAAAAAALLLGACASSDVGDILGPNGRVSQVQGIVRSVDTRGDCVVELDNARVSDYRLSDDRYGTNGGRSTVYCDRNTRVVYQGQTYRPEDLERGDEVVADVSDMNGRLVADRIDVTYDVSSNAPRVNPPFGGDRYGGGRYGGSYPPPPPPAGGPYTAPYGDDRYGANTDPYGGTHDLRGTVRSVDPQARTLTLDRVDYYTHAFGRRADSEVLTLYYDGDTQVLFRGQSYRPESLEPGDVLALKVDDVRGTLIADRIDVVTDARGSSAEVPPP